MFRNRYARIAAALLLTALPSFAQAITILQTTDLHHHGNGAAHIGLDVDPSGRSALGSHARIAAYINNVRATAGHAVVLVDSGDWTMGTFYDLTLGSKPLGPFFLNAMQYDCATLGNHEFDYTPAGLAAALASAQSAFSFQTPIVASNMDLGGFKDLAPFVRTTYTKDFGGIRVGFLGLMGENAAATAAGAAPVTFAALSTHYTAIQAMVDDLRNNQGAQIVIALSHSGTNAAGTAGEDTDLAAHVKGIDVIASGHTHTPLSAAHAVPNGAWTTQVIDAGAFGTNVFRIDLTYHPAAGNTTLDTAVNTPMTDAALAGLVPDPSIAAAIATFDQQINAGLAPFFQQVFPDYSSTNVAKGVYHPVGVAAQDMVATGSSPSGLGNLVVDALRSVPNGIIGQTLARTGGHLPGYDFTPVQLGVMASGEIRGILAGGVPLSFADVYNVLPLGFSPDPTQAIPSTSPLISGYMEFADLKTICAIQLVVQSGLAPGDYYLNLSGVRYSLKAPELNTFFKYTTAAAVLQTIGQKAVAGSTPAVIALAGLVNAPSDSGASLLAAASGGNAYAAAILKLNDANPTQSQIAANLAVVGEVAVTAAGSTSALGALISAKAFAAIDTISGFAPGDSANTGPATDLSGGGRIRLVSDLTAFALIGAVQSLAGVTIPIYQSATGPAKLSTADLAGLLANRIDADPSAAGIQELKPWMALLTYIVNANSPLYELFQTHGAYSGAGLGGFISSAYASSGAAVQVRNASYPLAAIGQLTATLAALQAAP